MISLSFKWFQYDGVNSFVTHHVIEERLNERLSGTISPTRFSFVRTYWIERVNCTSSICVDTSDYTSERESNVLAQKHETGRKKSTTLTNHVTVVREESFAVQHGLY
jgi:hypothetical protein